MGITYKCWTALASWLQGGTTSHTGDSPAWIGLETNSTMASGSSAYTISTNAPYIAPLATTGLGISLATLTLNTTTQAADTCRSTFTFTSATTASVYGHYCMTTSTAGNMMSWYAYAAVQNLASGDTLACTIDHQMVAGS